MAVASYIKNVSKSIKYSAIDSMKKMNPVVVSLYKDNEEAFNDVYKSISKLTGDSSSSEVKSVTGRVGGLAKGYFKNLYEDARSGNFYNKERIGRAEDMAADSMLNSDDEDFGIEWSDDFSSGGDTSDDDASFDFDDADEIASKTTAAIGMISARSAEYQVEANRQATKALLDQNAAVFGNIHSDLNAINTNVGMIADYLKGNTNTHYENSKSFYENTTAALNTTNELLAQLLEVNKAQAGMLAANSRNSNRVQFSDLFTSEGALDLASYGRLVKENIEELDGGTSDMLKMMLEEGMAEQMIASPLQGISDAIVKTIIPMAVADSMREFNKSLSGFFGSALRRLGEMSDDGGIMGMIGSLFGFKDDLKKDLDPSKYEKGPVPFDGITRKAIIEVIPTYLSKIYTTLSGSKESRFDYNKGKFVTIENLQKSMYEVLEKHSKSASFDTEYVMKQLLGSVDFAGGEAQRKEMETDMRKFFDYQLRTGKVFNKKTSAAKYGMNGNYSEDNLAIMQKLWEELPYSLRLEFAKSIGEGRAALNREMRDLEQKGISPLVALNNGSVDSRVFRPTRRPASTSIDEAAQGRRVIVSGTNTPSSIIVPERIERRATPPSSKESKIDQAKLKEALAAELRYLVDDDDDTILGDILHEVLADTDTAKGIQKYLKRPASMFGDIVNAIDKHMYEFVFGDEEWDKEVSKKGFMNAILERIQDSFNKFDTWLDDNIFMPIRERFNRRTLHDIGENVFSWFGLDYDETMNTVKDYFFGEDNGIFTGFRDGLKESFSGFRGWVGNAFKDLMKSTGINSAMNDLGIDKKIRNSEINKRIQNFLGNNRNAKKKNDTESILKNLSEMYDFTNEIVQEKKAYKKNKKERLEAKRKALKAKKNRKIKGAGEVEDIDSAAEGLQRVSKTGVIAVSEGEMIVPPDRNPYNIAQRLKAENMAKRDFADSIWNFAEGGTVGEAEEDKPKKLTIEDIIKKTDEYIKDPKSNDIGTIVNLINSIKDADDKKKLGEYFKKVEDKLKKSALGSKIGYNREDYDEEHLPFHMQVADELKNVGKFFAGKAKSTVSGAYDFMVDNSEMSEAAKLASKDVMANIRKYLPDATVGAGLGVTGSILTGMMINPILGAAAGAGIAIAKNSRAVQDWLFGKEITEGEDKGKREGGLLGKKTTDWFQKYLPDMAKGSTIGAIAGIFTGSPVIGAILGSSIGFAKNNQKIQEFLFGNEEEKGLLGKDFIPNLKHKLPKMGAGAVLGLLGGPFGLTANLLLGSAIGFATDTEVFKKVMFGEMDENGKRHGGIAGEFSRSVVEPNKIFFKTMYQDLRVWFKDTIVDNLKDFYRPLKQGVKNGINDVFNFIKQKSEDLYDRFLRTTLGKKIDQLFRGATNIFQGVAKGLFTAGKTLVGLPFKAVGAVGRRWTDKQIQQGRATDMSAAERMAWRNRNRYVNINAGKPDAFRVMDDTLATMSDEDVLKAYEDLQYASNAKKAIRDNKRQVIKDIKDLEELKFFNAKQERQILSLIEIGDEQRLNDFVDNLPFKIFDRDGNPHIVDRAALKATLKENMGKYHKAINAESNLDVVRSESMARLKEVFGLEDKDFSDERVRKLIESEAGFRKGDKSPESILATEQELEDARWRNLEDHEAQRHTDILEEFKSTREKLEELIVLTKDEDVVDIERLKERELTTSQKISQNIYYGNKAAAEKFRQAKLKAGEIGDDARDRVMQYFENQAAMTNFDNELNDAYSEKYLKFLDATGQTIEPYSFKEELGGLIDDITETKDRIISDMGFVKDNIVTELGAVRDAVIDSTTASVNSWAEGQAAMTNFDSLIDDAVIADKVKNSVDKAAEPKEEKPSLINDILNAPVYDSNASMIGAVEGQDQVQFSREFLDKAKSIGSNVKDFLFSDKAYNDFKPPAEKKTKFQGGEAIQYVTQPDGSMIANKADSETVEDANYDFNTLGPVSNYIAHDTMEFEDDDKTRTEFFQGNAIKYIKQGKDDWMVDKGDSESIEFLHERDEEKETQKGILSGIAALPNKFGSLFGMDEDAPEEKKKGFLATLFDNLFSGGWGSVAATLGGIGTLFALLPENVQAAVTGAIKGSGNFLKDVIHDALLGDGEGKEGLVRKGIKGAWNGVKNVGGKILSTLNPFSYLFKSDEEVADDREDLVVSATNAAKHSFLTGNGTKLAEFGEGLLGVGGKALQFLSNNKLAKTVEKLPFLGRFAKAGNFLGDTAGKILGSGSNLLTLSGDLGSFFLPEFITGKGTKSKIMEKIIREVNDLDGKNSLITDIATKGFKGTISDRFTNTKVGKVISKVTDPLAGFVKDNVLDKIKEKAGKYMAEHADDLIGKFLAKITKEIPEYLTNTKVVKFMKKALKGELSEVADKVFQEALERLAKALVARLSKYIKNEAAEAVGNALIRIGGAFATAGIANIALGVKAFMDGWFNADQIFEIGEPDAGMKLISALVSLLNDVVLQGIIPVDLLMEFIIGCMKQVPVFDQITASIVEKQNQLKDEVEAYNDSMGLEGDDRLSVDEYLEKDKLGARIKRTFRTAKELLKNEKNKAIESGDYANPAYMTIDPMAFMMNPESAMANASMNAYYMAQHEKNKANGSTVSEAIDSTFDSSKDVVSDIAETYSEASTNVEEKVQKSIKEATNGKFDDYWKGLENNDNSSLENILDYTTRTLLYPATAVNNMMAELEPTIADAAKSVENGGLSGTGGLIDLLTKNFKPSSSSTYSGGSVSSKSSSGTYNTFVDSEADDSTTDNTESTSIWQKVKNIFSGSGSGLRRRSLAGAASSIAKNSNPPTEDPYEVAPVSTLTGTDNEKKLTKDELFVSQTYNPLSNSTFTAPGDTVKQSVADAACAPAVATMAVNTAYRSGEGGRALTFRDAIRTAVNYKVPDSGVTADYFVEQFGNNGLSTAFISSKDPNRLENDVIGMLRQNRPVVLMGSDSTNNSKALSPFGPSSHYVLATGISDDGKYIYINDPENKKPNVAYPISILRSVDLGVTPVSKNPRLDSMIRQSKILASMRNYRATGLTGKTNQEKIFNFLRSQGVSAVVAAGIIGNMMQESKCIPGMTQGGKIYPDPNSWSGGPGTGLCQWEKDWKGKVGDRFRGLQAMAASMGKDWTDMEAQLMFLMKELKSESTYVSYLKSKFGMTPDQYLTFTGSGSAEDIKQATRIFCICFERCNESQANMDYRVEQAIAAYQSYSGNPVSSLSSTAIGAPNFHKYTDAKESDIRGIASIAYREQGTTPEGQMAEASLLLNLAERDYGTPYSIQKVAKMARSGWFADGSNRYDNPTVKKGDQYYEWAKSVVVDGKRTVPGYIDEHDYVGDIASATNDGVAINKNNPSEYKQHKTIIHQASQVGGGKWTFYTNPTGTTGSDPFGYTAKGAERRKTIGDGYYKVDGTPVGVSGGTETTVDEGIPAWAQPNSILDLFTVFDDLAHAYGLTASDSKVGGSSSSTVNDFGVNGGTVVSDAQKAALQKRLAESFIKSENNLKVYSQTNRYAYKFDDNDVITGTSADCSSLTQGLYKHILGENADPGGWTGDMLQSPNTYVVEKGGAKPGDAPSLSKLQLGDLIIYGPGDGKHVELYTGGNRTMGHGSAPGPHYANPTSSSTTELINYHSEHNGLNEVRRWNGFKMAGSGSGLLKKAGEKVSSVIKSANKVRTDKFAELRTAFAGKGSELLEDMGNTVAEVSYTPKAKPDFATNNIKDAFNDAYNYSVSKGSDVYVNATTNNNVAPQPVVTTTDNSAQILTMFKSMIKLMAQMVENTDNMKQIVALVTELVSIASADKSSNTPEEKQEKKREAANIKANLMSALNSANGSSSPNAEIVKLIKDMEAIAAI